MTRITSILCLILATAFLAMSGCSSSSTEPEDPAPSAQIRVVHASPDLGAVDVYISDATEPWFEDLAFKMTTTYKSGSPTTLALVFRTAGDPATADPLFTSDDITLASGNSMTAVAMGMTQSMDPADEFRLLTYRDTWSEHGVDETRVRIINAGSNAPTLSFKVIDFDILAISMPRWSESGQGGVHFPAAAETDVGVYDEQGVAAFRVPELAATQDFYFIVTGLTGETGANAFTMLVVGPGGTMDLVDQGSRDLRIVHTSPDSGDLDAYLLTGVGEDFTRTTIQTVLEYGDVTAYGGVDQRVGIVEFYYADTDPNSAEPVLWADFQLSEEAASSTAFLFGLDYNLVPADILRLTILHDGFADAPADSFQVRFVHGVVDAGDLRIDVGDDGSMEADLERFTGGDENGVSLDADTALTIVVRDDTSILGTFTTPAYAEGVDHYLVLLGLTDGTPNFGLQSITETEALGITMPDVGF